MIRLAVLSMMVAFTGAIVPGPLFAVALQQALLVGWTAGLWLSVGHMLAELGLLAVLRAGLGGLLKRLVVARAIGIVGGAVMLYFAWGMVTTALGGPIATAAHHGHRLGLSAVALVGQGVALSIFNPYWIIWWATVGMGLIASQLSKSGNRAWAVFFVGHTLADFIWYVGITLLIGFGGALLPQSVHRGLILVCGAGLAVLGVLFLVRPVIDWARGRRRTE
jgi:threonine/homoserine/homoserine lactone efflux protein